MYIFGSVYEVFLKGGWDYWVDANAKHDVFQSLGLSHLEGGS